MSWTNVAHGYYSLLEMTTLYNRLTVQNSTLEGATKGNYMRLVFLQEPALPFRGWRESTDIIGVEGILGKWSTQA